jgi:hypothetical protein
MTVASVSKVWARSGAAPHVVGAQILRAVRDAVQRPAPASRGDLGLGASRLTERALARDRDHRVVARAQALEALEKGLGEGNGR